MVESRSKGLGAGEGTDCRAYLEMCPSRRSTVLICERRSGSCVVGVYVDTAFGTRTGVVGSASIVIISLGGSDRSGVEDVDEFELKASFNLGTSMRSLNWKRKLDGEMG